MTKTSVTSRPITRLKQILVEEGRRQDWLVARANEYLSERGLDQLDASMLSRYVNGLHCPDDRQKAIAEALGRAVEDVFPR